MKSRRRLAINSIQSHIWWTKHQLVNRVSGVKVSWKRRCHSCLSATNGSDSIDDHPRINHPKTYHQAVDILERMNDQITQFLEARQLRFSTRLKSLEPVYHDLTKRRYQTLTESSFRARLCHAGELPWPCTRPKLA